MLYIFDLDGTLTNTLQTIAYFGNYALTAHGFAPIEPERYKTLVGDGMDILIHRMLQEYNADTDELFHRVRKTYDDAYSADFLHDTTVYGGIVQALGALKKRGDRLAVLSNKPHHVVVPIVNALFDNNLFDLVYGQRNDTPKKPAPDGALSICQKLSVRLQDAVFVGDTNVDIMTGKNAGMTTVGVLWGFRSKQELTDAGADYVIDAPAQLLTVK